MIILDEFLRKQTVESIYGRKLKDIVDLMIVATEK